MNDVDPMQLSLETTPEPLTPALLAHANTPSAAAKLSEALRACSPLPASVIFIGAAGDGLPVVLNLRDPVTGPVLIAADAHGGKTRLLKMIAESVDRTHDPESVRYSVISDRLGEWDGLEVSPNCESVLSFQHPLTANYLASLVESAHSEKRLRPFILLFVDGLDALARDGEIQSAMRWLFLRGPSRRIWPLVTVNSSSGVTLAPWLASFRTRLYGHIREASAAMMLTGAAADILGRLASGSQFAMFERGAWLPFWIPDPD